MKHETLIKANTLTDKIKNTQEIINKLNKMNISDIQFNEEFNDDCIHLSYPDKEEGEDIQSIINYYIDILSKRILKLQKEFDNL